MRACAKSCVRVTAGSAEVRRDRDFRRIQRRTIRNDFAAFYVVPAKNRSAIHRRTRNLRRRRKNKVCTQFAFRYVFGRKGKFLRKLNVYRNGLRKHRRNRHIAQYKRRIRNFLSFSVYPVQDFSVKGVGDLFRRRQRQLIARLELGHVIFRYRDAIGKIERNNRVFCQYGFNRDISLDTNAFYNRRTVRINPTKQVVSRRIRNLCRRRKNKFIVRMYVRLIIAYRKSSRKIQRDRSRFSGRRILDFHRNADGKIVNVLFHLDQRQGIRVRLAPRCVQRNKIAGRACCKRNGLRRQHFRRVLPSRSAIHLVRSKRNFFRTKVRERIIISILLTFLSCVRGYPTEIGILRQRTANVHTGCQITVQNGIFVGDSS